MFIDAGIADKASERTHEYRGPFIWLNLQNNLEVLIEGILIEVLSGYDRAGLGRGAA